MKKTIKLWVYSVFRYISRLFWILPLQNKVIISSYRGKGYCDNPKYIIEELVNDKRIEADICCVVKDLSIEVPSYIRKVKKNTIFEIYEYATAKLLINNTRFPLYIQKRKNQIYIATWHGGFSLKKIGMAMQDIDSIGIASVKHDAETADLMISNSAFCTEMYRRDFLYYGDVLEVGSPRLDSLFSNSNKKEILQKLGIDSQKKIAMYAPTFRDDGNLTVYDIDYFRIKVALETRFGGEWVILVRFHPNMSTYSESMKYSNWLINATIIPDIYDVIKVLDCMISDYSSIGLEYSILGKPLFLYVKDLETYQAERGLYFRIEELPFPIAKSNDELVKIILDYSDDGYKTKVNKWLKDIGCKEMGIASREVARYIYDRITFS